LFIVLVCYVHCTQVFVSLAGNLKINDGGGSKGAGKGGGV
jgi:hypothetical protein